MYGDRSCQKVTSEYYFSAWLVKLGSPSHSFPEIVRKAGRVPCVSHTRIRAHCEHACMRARVLLRAAAGLVDALLGNHAYTWQHRTTGSHSTWSGPVCGCRPTDTRPPQINLGLIRRIHLIYFFIATQETLPLIPRLPLDSAWTVTTLL